MKRRQRDRRPRCPPESPHPPLHLHLGHREPILWDPTLPPGEAGVTERVRDFCPGLFSVLSCDQPRLPHEASGWSLRAPMRPGQIWCPPLAAVCTRTLTRSLGSGLILSQRSFSQGPFSVPFRAGRLPRPFLQPQAWGQTHMLLRWEMCPFFSGCGCHPTVLWTPPTVEKDHEVHGQRRKHTQGREELVAI